MSFTGVSATFADLRASLRSFEQQAVAQARADTMSVLQMLLDITPVNTGETVRNFTVSVGAPSRALKAPLGQQPPLPTNALALGSEPNRAANAAAATADAQAALATLTTLKPIFISNSVAQWGLIESGSAPGAPWNNRGSGGHTGLAQAKLRSTGNWK